MTYRMIKAAFYGGAFLIAASPALAGDPAPGVDVLLEQIPGGVKHTGSVDDNGHVTFAAVPVGNYRVTFTKRAAEPPQEVQAQVRKLKKGEIEQLMRRGLGEALSQRVDRVQPAPAAPAQPPAPAAPAQHSVCLQSEKPAASYKTGAQSCSPVSGVSIIGNVSEFSLDETMLASGPICSEIAITGAGSLSFAVVKADAPRGPLAAESLNSARSNTGNVTETANERGAPRN